MLWEQGTACAKDVPRHSNTGAKTSGGSVPLMASKRSPHVTCDMALEAVSLVRTRSHSLA